MKTLQQQFDEMKQQFPETCKVLNEKGEEETHSVQIFLYDKKYNDFETKVYALLMPACFIGSDIYVNNEFQYSIGTWAGEWKEKLTILEDFLEQVSKDGIIEAKENKNEQLELRCRKFEDLF